MKKKLEEKKEEVAKKTISTLGQISQRLQRLFKKVQDEQTKKHNI